MEENLKIRQTRRNYRVTFVCFSFRLFWLTTSVGFPYISPKQSTECTLYVDILYIFCHDVILFCFSFLMIMLRFVYYLEMSLFTEARICTSKKKSGGLKRGVMRLVVGNGFIISYVFFHTECSNRHCRKH